jgi:chromosome segregation ATPase
MSSVAEAIAKAPSKLRPVLLELAEALRADRIEVLEGRLGAVERTLETLAEAQARTDASVQRLAEAQARTDANVQRLAEAQARTDANVQRLAEAQARTERALADLARQVGGLSDTIGFTLEEMGRIRVHDYLERREFQLAEIERRIITTDRGEVEFDLYAEGTMAREQVVVVGEVKSRISEREAGLFLERLDLVSAAVPSGHRLVPVLFGFLIHPRARLLIQERGGFAIESYQR